MDLLILLYRFSSFLSLAFVPVIASFGTFESKKIPRPCKSEENFILFVFQRRDHELVLDCGCDKGFTVFKSAFLHHVVEIPPHAVFGYSEFVRYLLIRQPANVPSEYIELPWRECIGHSFLHFHSGCSRLEHSLAVKSTPDFAFVSIYGSTREVTMTIFICGNAFFILSAAASPECLCCVCTYIKTS